MTDSAADTAKLQTQLAQDFIDQKKLQLFSVIYEPINRASFMNAINRRVR